MVRPRRPGPLSLLVVGDGPRARAWSEVADRSQRLRRVGLVARRAPATAVLPWWPSLEAALDAQPAAVVAVALPPRSALDAARMLAIRGRPALVQAPLDRALAGLAPTPGDAGVQVAHGWVTLPSLRALRRSPPASLRRVVIEAAGLPESADGDLEDVLVHALALARHLTPRSRPLAASLLSDSELDVLLGDDPRVELRIRARGWHIHLHLECRDGSIVVDWRDGSERVVVESRGVSRERVRAAPDGASRALAQLADPERSGGDTLTDARSVAGLAGEVVALAGGSLPIGRRQLAQAARVWTERPDDILARLGLSGEIPDVPPAAVVEVPTGPEPWEYWAFRAGLKPVVFLTVRPENEGATRRLFPGAHVERRERRVSIGPQDAWRDHRGEGDARVELFVSAEASLALRAADMQASEDPSRRAVELGELMGYPACCVGAFARCADRANNTYNRYLTASRTVGATGWPWELNNLFAMVVPFYPCHYLCPRALAFARATIASLEAARPEVVARLRDLLSRPVLYFDHDHQVLLDGTFHAGGVDVRSAEVLPGAGPELARLAGALAGGRLELRHDALCFARGTLLRTDPALGLLAPFAPAGG